MVLGCSSNRQLIQGSGIREVAGTNYDYDYYYGKKVSRNNGTFSQIFRFYKNDKLIIKVKCRYVPMLGSNFLIFEKVIVKDSSGKVIYKRIDKRHALYDAALESIKNK